MPSMNSVPVKKRFGQPPLVIEMTAIAPTYEEDQRGDQRKYDAVLITDDQEGENGSWRITPELFSQLRSALSGDLGEQILTWMAGKPARTPLPTRPGEVEPYQPEPNSSNSGAVARVPQSGSRLPLSRASAHHAAVTHQSGFDPRKPWLLIGPISQDIKWWTHANAEPRYRRPGVVVPGSPTEIGMLKTLGYSVGESSTLSDTVRSEILSIALFAELPIVDSEDYTRSWGRPLSKERASRIEEALRHFIRLHSEQRGHAVAVCEWSRDLAWFERSYGDRILRT